MIVDSSVMVAMLLEEPEGHLFDVAIARSAVSRMSSASYFESSIILQSRKGEEGLRGLDLLIARFRIEIVAFTESQARLARAAFVRYGKGRHPAMLNFGDCIAYALARETGEELLFKGADFSQTDIAVATY